jgi:hypothetical protein
MVRGHGDVVPAADIVRIQPDGLGGFFERHLHVAQELHMAHGLLLGGGLGAQQANREVEHVGVGSTSLWHRRLPSA